MFQEREIRSVLVRLGWWFHNFVFCVGGRFAWYCYSEGVIRGFWKTKDSGLSFYSGYAKINSYGNGKKCDF